MHCLRASIFHPDRFRMLRRTKKRRFEHCRSREEIPLNALPLWSKLKKLYLQLLSTIRRQLNIPQCSHFNTLRIVLMHYWLSPFCPNQRVTFREPELLSKRHSRMILPIHIYWPEVRSLPSDRERLGRLRDLSM